MDFSMLDRDDRSDAAPASSAELRSAPRYVSLIRAAKLVTSQGEFVCVVRDVSQTGVKVRLFHPLPPTDGSIALELQNGERFALRLVRAGEGEASFTFAQTVAIERLIREHWSHPKRQFRLNLDLPVHVHTGPLSCPGQIANISQQGARLAVDARFATNQLLRIEAAQLAAIHAKVRWQRKQALGVVFEETFSLSGIAQLAAAIQCPQLLRGDGTLAPGATP